MSPAARQLAALNRLVAEIANTNRFYRAKLAAADGLLGFASLADFSARMPFTTKDELARDQIAHPPYGTTLTYPQETYTRYHQTSGTSGRPLVWLDNNESWAWLLENWRGIWRAADARPGDAAFFAFSFGPFLGFWTAFEAASRMGCLCLASGGLSSGARLKMLLDNRATVLLCTPTYALHLAECAREQGVEIKGVLRAIIVAGEPGGSIPATRARIEDAWQARVFDHTGMTEIGPLAIECSAQPGGLHTLDEDYFAEVVDPVSGKPTKRGEMGVLVLTNLGRLGSPLIRYRTGDIVRVDPAPCPCGSPWMRLVGGILGRTDDMIAVRGNNVYPSALENVIRRFPEIGEYRVTIDQTVSMTEVRIEYEAEVDGLNEPLASAIRDDLLFRADVSQVPTGTLPRFEMKARRVVVRK